ncbi:MAG: PLP-dependent aminotransferase family protein [Caldilineaceae bacterium]|nr:PLP-dependent aminotransferase family protein [Caldilineaceae bacterium]
MTNVTIQLARDNGVALYQQIVDQVKSQIRTRHLPSGTRLPTIRQLAQELGVTRVTVQNAYDELQASGWVESTVGRGTFVGEGIAPTAAFATVTERFGQPLNADAMIDDLLQIHQIQAQQQHTGHSLALASPDPRLFPMESFAESWQAVFQDARALLCYGSPQGDPHLRLIMADLLEKRGVTVHPDGIIITNGLTHGLSLVVQALTQPGDRVLVEQPTYLGFLNLLKAYRLEPIGVPMDAEGPAMAMLEQLAVQYRPRFFYTIPSYQNPTGLCVSTERRQSLVAWAERHGIVLIEDDIYARLAYDGETPPAMKQVDRSGVVIYTTSESKVLFPGLRIGTIVAPRPLHERILALRRATDLCGSSILQRAFAHFVQQKGLQQHLRRVLPIYRRRRDVMVTMLRRTMPPGVSWSEPAGGYCIWLTLPRLSTLHDLPQAALQQGLAIAAGDVFLTQPGAHYHLRLAFSYEDEETIRRCVQLLSHLIAERIHQATEQDATPIDWLPLV